ncbi:hypothetical protein LINPERPRIM_LOCUS32980 [Linum perenne]
MFHEHNVLARVFRSARDRINLGNVESVKIKLVAKRTSDGREYDLPTVDEQAGLIVDETGEDTFQPDIVVQYLTNSMERVKCTHSSLMALQYPILFPYGEDGWHGNILLRNSNTRRHLSQFDAHINVEYCNKIEAIKYLFKYINKPPDRDEIKAFMDCRYITPGEACWRLFKFELYNNNPSVQRLSYHLPGQQPVFSTMNSTMDELLEAELAHISMLLEWMERNKYDLEARKYTFLEFPKHYVWTTTSKKWTPRKRKYCIGRIYNCPPSSNERFYLRMLLHIVKGCTSFEEIRTVNDVQYDSFQAACNAYGILTDDGEWHNCLHEVSFTATPKQMRMLFVTIIMYSRVANVGDLWCKNWELLSDDIQYLRRQELKLPHLEMSQSDVQDFCLVEIEKLLHKFGRTLLDFPGLPILSNKSLNISSNSLLAEEVQYDHIALGAAFQSQVRMLNAKQGLAFHAIIDSIEQNRHQIFFIDGFGGTGKTFLWQVISLKLRSDHLRYCCITYDRWSDSTLPFSYSN